MEPVGALPEGEWSSFSGMFSTEEADFMAQLLGNYPNPNEQDGGSSLGIPSTLWPGYDATRNMAVGDDSLYYSSDTLNSNSYYLPQVRGISSGSSLFVPSSDHESYYLCESNPNLVTNNSSVSIDFCTVDEKNTSSSVQVFPDNLMEEAVFLNEETSNDNLRESGGNQPEAVVLPDSILQSKRKFKMPKLETVTEDKNNTKLCENPKKKSRVSGDVQRDKKNVQSKNQKLVLTSNGEEDSNTGLNRQSSSSYCSEDDSNASQELNGGTTSTSKGSAALNLHGKTRASRGSATDPQSLYARKRRERINERLRILQNLVPNGTKVDISTMLEEAVQYVKFLQLQIKLLSSDDLWMYAPIAYNGMDIGFDLKISLPHDVRR
ncbi:hypothetical protein HHK36_009789 [Tetracentron sinense]|uniref:BHLH domain-containing protein n=1 Tax=Tetracentron sinense TaxID=13715 RepID=A0A834ZCE7_TETSI|nr:hypothetical protein HHK36_009789 [Tetracentron sinense]